MPQASIAVLLERLEGTAGQPALTWYDDDGRIELSGHVLANWVIKTTNLLVEELDAGPGSRIIIDLPPHWRLAVWALAAWRCGATVVLDAVSDTPADIVVTSRPEYWDAPSADLIAVALPGLARRFDGALPPGAIDAAAAVMTYGDRLGYVPAPEPGSTALTIGGDGPSITHERLEDWAAEVWSGAASPPSLNVARTLLESSPSEASLLLAALLVHAAAGGSLSVAPKSWTSERRARIASDERAIAIRGA